MIDVLLADDHPMILRGLRDLFAGYDDLRVVGEETNGLKVVEAVGRLKPDVLVLDYVMPGISAVEIIGQVTRKCPRTRIVVLSMHSSVPYVWEALRSGALGYVLKCVEGEELVRAVRQVYRSERYLSPPLSEAELEEYVGQLQQRSSARAEPTKRELQVLRLVAQGHTTDEIAKTLRISRRTVESHRASLLSKLGLRNQADLIRYAVQRGIVSP